MMKLRVHCDIRSGRGCYPTVIVVADDGTQTDISQLVQSMDIHFAAGEVPHGELRLFPADIEFTGDALLALTGETDLVGALTAAVTERMRHDSRVGGWPRV